MYIVASGSTKSSCWRRLGRVMTQLLCIKSKLLWHHSFMRLFVFALSPSCSNQKVSYAFSAFYIDFSTSSYFSACTEEWECRNQLRKQKNLRLFVATRKNSFLRSFAQTLICVRQWRFPLRDLNLKPSIFDSSLVCSVRKFRTTVCLKIMDVWLCSKNFQVRNVLRMCLKSVENARVIQIEKFAEKFTRGTQKKPWPCMLPAQLLCRVLLFVVLHIH